MFVITGLFHSDAAYFHRLDPQVGPIKYARMLAATNQRAERGGRYSSFMIGGGQAAKMHKIRCCMGSEGFLRVISVSKDRFAIFCMF